MSVCRHSGQVHDEAQGATFCARCGDWVIPEDEPTLELHSTLLGVLEGEQGVRLPPIGENVPNDDS